MTEVDKLKIEVYDLSQARNTLIDQANELLKEIEARNIQIAKIVQSDELS